MSDASEISTNPYEEELYGVIRSSATNPDWDREKPTQFWDPSKKVIRSIRRYCYWDSRPGLLPKLIKRYWVLQHRFWCAVAGCEIRIDSPNIGGGFAMPHPGGVLLGGYRAKLGPNLWVASGVKIVNRGLNLPEDRPGSVIGGGVTIGTGAIIAGPVNIGDHAVIGAGAVVIKDVPARHMAIGNPARNIPLDPALREKSES